MMVMPEEQNRRLTDLLSTWLFCPTATAIDNLASEGIRDTAEKHPSSDRKRVANVGDIMLEASLYYRGKALERSGEGLPSTTGVSGGFALLTLHRAENTDDPGRLRNIAAALNLLDDMRFVFPVHPRTKKIMASLGIELGSHIKKIEPVGYLEMIRLESECDFVVTDSGGVQKEAFFFGKPCVTLRDSTGVDRAGGRRMEHHRGVGYRTRRGRGEEPAKADRAAHSVRRRKMRRKDNARTNVGS